MIIMAALRLLTILTLAISVIMIFGNGASVVHAETPPIFRGDSITISAVLLENVTYGNPIQNQKMEFYDQTNDVFLGTALTDENGVASIRWDIPLSQPLGETIINSTFRGNESLFLDPSVQLIRITIFSRTEILIQSDSTTLAPGDNCSIRARLVDDMGNGISNICISAFVNDLYVFSTFTNSSGYFEFEIKYDSSLFNLGVNFVKVATVDSSQSFYFYSFKTIIVEYHKLRVALSEFVPANMNINLNDSMSLILYAQSDGSPLNGVGLDVFIDDMYMGTWITDGGGLANISLIVDGSVDIGKHTIGILFLGNYRYEKARLEIKINVYSISIIEAVFPEKLVTRSYSSFYLAIHDAFGRPYNNITIGVTDSVSNYTCWIKARSTDEVQVPYIPVGPRGPRMLTITIINQPFIINKTWNITIDVWAKPSINIVTQSIYGYAMPMQAITITCRLEDNMRVLENVVILLSNRDGSFYQSVFTNESGYATIEWRAQSQVGLDYMDIIFQGDNSSYYLSNRLRYEYQVSRQIPMGIIMKSCNPIIPLRIITVCLQVVAHNGSRISGLSIDYYWLELKGHATSGKSGTIYFDISMPSSNGTFLLYYKTQYLEGLAPSNGTFSIIIDYAQAQAAEGIGINGLFASCITLVISSIVPFLRRRYLIGM